jgi:hypothetical protein
LLKHKRFLLQLKNSCRIFRGFLGSFWIGFLADFWLQKIFGGAGFLALISVLYSTFSQLLPICKGKA